MLSGSPPSSSLRESSGSPSRTRERFFGLVTPFLTLVALICAAWNPASADAAEADKHKVEAAFIYQFTNYIEWPADALGPETSNFVVTVLGNTPLLDELKGFEAQKKFKGKTLEIRQATGAGPLPKAHIVFIAENQADRLEAVLRQFNGTATLVVTEGEGLGKKGSMINFISEDGRLRFEINRNSVQKQRLQIGSQLLHLARTIE